MYSIICILKYTNIMNYEYNEFYNVYMTYYISIYSDISLNHIILLYLCTLCFNTKAKSVLQLIILQWYIGVSTSKKRVTFYYFYVLYLKNTWIDWLRRALSDPRARAASLRKSTNYNTRTLRGSAPFLIEKLYHGKCNAIFTKYFI